jgi:D-alanine-D-alanine ligase
MKKNMLVMFGGPSVEHDVSLITANQAIKQIDENKYRIILFYWTRDGRFLVTHYHNKPIISLAKFCEKGQEASIKKGKVVVRSYIGASQIKVDVCLPLFHGTYGEDGAIQGLLEAMDVPYIGCGVTSSALGMDKVLFKAVLNENKIPVLNYSKVTNISQLTDIKLSYPMIAKPAHLGSSIGVKKVNNETDLRDAVNVILSLDSVAIIEPYLSNMMEVNCSVLGSTKECKASVTEQPISTEEILSFADKYMRGGKGKKTGSKNGMAGLDRRIPAPIDKLQEDKIKKYAVEVFKSLGCSGVSRVDFMIDKKTNNIYVTEINTIPVSLSFYLWEASGITYKELIDKLVGIADFEHAEKNKLIRAVATPLS